MDNVLDNDVLDDEVLDEVLESFEKVPSLVVCGDTIQRNTHARIR